MLIQGVTLTGTYVVDVGIVPGAVINLDTETGISGNTWLNTGSLGSTLDYTLFNTPTTTTVNGHTVLNFPGGTGENPGSMTKPYAFNGTGLTTLGTSASQAFTLDIWAYPRAANAGCLIKEYGQSSGGAPSGGWEDAWINFYNGSINTSVWPYANPILASSYTTDTWYNVVMVYNGSNQLKVYVNNVLGTTQTITRQVSNTSTMLTVAGPERYNYLGGANDYFNGYVGPFKIYYSALNDAQLTQNYNAISWRYN